MLDYIKNLKKHPKRRSMPKNHPFNMRFGKAAKPKDVLDIERYHSEKRAYIAIRKRSHALPGYEDIVKKGSK